MPGIKSDLAKMLKADGFSSVAEAVGADHRNELTRMYYNKESSGSNSNSGVGACLIGERGGGNSKGQPKDDADSSGNQKKKARWWFW